MTETKIIKIKTPLPEYLALPRKSQQGLADSLERVSQSAISKMLRVKRNIVVVEDAGGELLELREDKLIATKKLSNETSSKPPNI